MKKVLIISYFYPPCNLTSGQRVLSWAQNLKNFGYHPIIITRSWNNPIQNLKDILIPSGTDIVHEQNDTHEVYYLPYKASYRDRYYVKHHGSQLQQLSKVFTAVNLVSENFNVKSIPHHNIYDFARSYLIQNNDVQTVIVSGNPFNLFQFGYLLKKEFNINWIADYRDDWNTNELKKKYKFLIGALQLHSEKKWLSNAYCFTTVSEYYKQKIEKLVGKPGYVLANGYEFEGVKESKVSSDKFVITYNGSLYPAQDLESFISVIVQLIKEGFKEIFVEFPGAAFDKQQEYRLKKLTETISSHVHIMLRIERTEVLAMQQNSDVLLMLSYTNLKGIPSSKLYEYIGLRKPILVFPNDFDVIESTLKDTGLGFTCDNRQQLYDTLKDMLVKKREGHKLLGEINENAIDSYSRKSQVKKLADIIDSIPVLS